MRITRGAGGIGTDYFLVALANGQAYGAVNTQAATSGLQSIFELVNPAGSGKTVRVRYVVVSVGVATQVIMTGTSGDQGNPSSGIQNLKTGGPAGVAKFEMGTTAAPPFGAFISFDAPALQAVFLTPGWVMELPAGNQIHIYANQNNVLLRCMVAWIEV